MSIEPALFGFAGLTSLALAMPKHRASLSFAVKTSPRTARVLGWVLLLAAAAIAVVSAGPAFGIVAWVGQLSVASAVLALLMSWRPAYAPTAAILALAATPLFAL